MNPLNVNKDNIWNFKQNRPSLISRDLESFFHIPRYLSARILMARGVYKWFAARRDIIKLKNIWKERLTKLYEKSRQSKKGSNAHARVVGQILAIEQCRKELREICHSERWRIPDNDWHHPLNEN